MSGDDWRPQEGSSARLLFAGGLAAMLLIVGVAAVLLFRKPLAPAAVPPPAPTPIAATAPTPQAQPVPLPSPVTPQPVVNTAFSDAQSATRALRAAVESLKGDTETALRQFEAANGWLAQRWPRLDTAERRAAIDAVVQFFYGASGWPEVASAAIDDIGEQAVILNGGQGRLEPDEVWPTAWCSGVLLRLSREQGLPTELVAQIKQCLTASLGEDRPRLDSSFEGGVLAALRRMVPVMLLGDNNAAEPVGRAFDNWALAITALTPDANQREALSVEALEQTMTSGAEADADRGVYAAIRALTLSTSWRESGPARARLVDWFRDSRVSMRDLHVLTSALAGESSAQGVTPEMVLAWDADPGRRDELRARYAAAWGIADALAGDSASEAWMQSAINTLIRPPQERPDPQELLAETVELAIIHQAARRLWMGDAAGCESLIAAAQQQHAKFEASSLGATPNNTSSGAVFYIAGREGEETWARRFLAAGKNIPIRLEFLKEIQNAGELVAMDAEVLIETACFGSPAEVRATAQDIAMRHAGKAVIMNAMLESLPRAPKIESVSRMVEAIAAVPLPPVMDPQWPTLARRALVVRLMERLASAGSLAGMDAHATRLMDAYIDDTGDAEPIEGTPADGSSLAATAEVMSRQWEQWLARARGLSPNPASSLTLEEIEARRAGRLGLAVGPVQRWAAEQINLAEIMAYVMVGEQPARSTAVKAVMSDLAAARRSSSHVFEQSLWTERAMLRLWALRYGQEIQ